MSSLPGVFSNALITAFGGYFVLYALRIVSTDTFGAFVILFLAAGPLWVGVLNLRGYVRRLRQVRRPTSS